MSAASPCDCFCPRMVEASKSRALAEEHRLSAIKLHESAKQDDLKAELLKRKSELKRYDAKVTPPPFIKVVLLPINQK